MIMWAKMDCSTVILYRISRWKTHVDRVKTQASWKSQTGWPEFHWRTFHWLSCYSPVSRRTFVLSDPWKAAVLSGQRRSSRKRWESSRQPVSSQTGTEHPRWFSGLGDTQSLTTRCSYFECHFTHNLSFNSIGLMLKTNFSSNSNTSSVNRYLVFMVEFCHLPTA